MTALSSCCRRDSRRRHQLGGLDRVEPGLDPVDVLARAGESVLGDLRLGALALDLADAVRLAEHEAPVRDRDS